MNLHARVVALERRREQRGGRNRYSEEVEDELRRLTRCERTQKEFLEARARVVEIVDQGRAARTGQRANSQEAFLAVIEALKPAELEGLTRRPEWAALMHAYERRQAAWEDARRHSERWHEDRRRERLNGAG